MWLVVSLVAIAIGIGAAALTRRDPSTAAVI